MSDSPLSLDQLRAAFVASEPSDAPGPDCLGPEEILSAVREELPPADLRRVLGHIAGCPICTEAWRLAEELESSAAETELRVPSPKGRETPWLRIAAAAAVILVVGIVAQNQWMGSVPEPVTRATPGASLELTIGDEPLSRADAHLRWTPIEGALYDVLVSTAALDILAQAEGVEVPEYRIPAPALADLAPGQELSVYIEAQRPGDGRLASGTFSVVVD